jgi:hypothetical protein
MSKDINANVVTVDQIIETIKMTINNLEHVALTVILNVGDGPLGKVTTSLHMSHLYDLDPNLFTRIVDEFEGRYYESLNTCWLELPTAVEGASVTVFFSGADVPRVVRAAYKLAPDTLTFDEIREALKF